MPYDDDDDDRMSWTSTGTASSWIRSHKSSIHLSPKYSSRHYIPHLSPLYRATFKSSPKGNRRRHDTGSSGTVSPDDWYYYSDNSSRNLSPSTYSPRVTKDNSANTTTDYFTDNSDVEFEPFPWVTFDDDDNVTTEPLFIDITDQSKASSSSRPDLLIPYGPPDGNQLLEDEAIGDDSGIFSHPEQPPADTTLIYHGKQSPVDAISEPVRNAPADSYSMPDKEPTVETAEIGKDTSKVSPVDTTSKPVRNSSADTCSTSTNQPPVEPAKISKDAFPNDVHTVSTGMGANPGKRGKLLPIPPDIPDKPGDEIKAPGDAENGHSRPIDLIDINSQVPPPDGQYLQSSDKGTNTEVEQDVWSDQLVSEVSLPMQAASTLKQAKSQETSNKFPKRIEQAKSWRCFNTVFFTTLILTVALALMMYFPICCEKTEYYYGIPGLRVHHRSIPPH